MTKVAEFIGSIQDGGAETLVKDYVLKLNREKFDPVVIVLRRSPQTANDRILMENGIRVIPICKSNFLFLKAIQKLNYRWYIPYRLKRILKKENIEIMHIHLDLLHYVKRIAGRIKNISLLYTCHSEPARLLAGNRMYENKAAKSLIKNNNLQMIALHDKMRREINRMFDIDNTVVIRNGIDFNRFKNVAETKEQIRQSLNIPLDAFVVGHVGRFSEVKNHTFLVDIFSELCRCKENAFLLLIGDGPLKKQIEEKLNSLGLHGKYLILSHRSDIPQLMKAMDVFVFPSKFEGLGIAFIEAQVSGLKCIGSDTIPREAFKTESAIPMSLDKSPSEWCNVILDNYVKGISNGNIEDYDMNREIKRLEQLYSGDLNG